jgi:hypothetical protein
LDWGDSTDWEKSLQQTNVRNLGGRREQYVMVNGILNKECQFKLPNGSMLEWDGPVHDAEGEWRLFDYRSPCPNSLYPPIIAVLRPARNHKEFTQMDVLESVVNLSHLLDYLVCT